MKREKYDGLQLCLGRLRMEFKLIMIVGPSRPYKIWCSREPFDSDRTVMILVKTHGVAPHHQPTRRDRR